MRLNLNNNINNRIQHIYKNLENIEVQSRDMDTGEQNLNPPVNLDYAKYVFDNSSYVAKCCRILAKDVILNDLTLINEDEHVSDTVVEKIQNNLELYVDEVYNMLIDFYYSCYGVLEVATDKHNFRLKQIPVNTTRLLRIKQGIILEQKLQGTTTYYKIIGEEYPDDFINYNGQGMGMVALLGGDNFYKYYHQPLWLQEKDKIFTEIAISNRNYNTISNGNIATGILNINLEPQLVKPVTEDGETVSREEAIAEELMDNDTGIAVVFTESNRPVKFDFTNIENDNYSYLESLQEKAEQSVLNCYNIPLARLMINTEKESMNSNKTQSIWEIYTLDLRKEQDRVKRYLSDLIYELYHIRVEIELSVPIFSDRREIEIGVILDEWNNGLLTLEETIKALSEYSPNIDLNTYDFESQRYLWDYRKIENYYGDIDDEEMGLPFE